MLSAIREFFDKHLGTTGAAQEDEDQRIRIATAALLTEMARMDGEVDAAETAAALNAVREKFGLSAEDAATLIGLADAEVREAPDYCARSPICCTCRTRPWSRQRSRRATAPAADISASGCGPATGAWR